MSDKTINKPCSFCGNEKLNWIVGIEPWTDDHYQCLKCNSTYCTFQVEKEVNETEKK